MSRHSEFVEFVIEQMAVMGSARARKMFGGYGVYLDDLMFAIIVDDRLYFKVDATTKADFETRNLQPFTYTARGKTVTMQYCEAPPEVLEEPAAMAEWARKAFGVAMRANRSKTKRVSTRARVPRQA